MEEQPWRCRWIMNGHSGRSACLHAAGEAPRPSQSTAGVPLSKVPNPQNAVSLEILQESQILS